MVTKQVKPKNKDRLATEERLLEAAEQVFSKHGFKGATTRMIAKKADVNVALIARYFYGKYGLMLRFIERKAQECKFVELNYPPKETVTEECMAFAKQRLLFFIDDMNLFKIVMVQFLTDAKFLKKYHESLIIFETNPEAANRLNNLMAQKKMIDTISATRVLEIIEDQLFSMVMGKLLIDNLPIEQVNLLIEEFIILFCKSLEYKE